MSQSPLHRRADGRWECHSSLNGSPLFGYCMSPSYVLAMSMGQPIEGVAWADRDHALQSAVAKCPWINEESWEHDRKLRIEHKKKFHSHGHATEEEAIICYQEFLADFGIPEMATL